jgi:hypothetical protein
MPAGKRLVSRERKLNQLGFFKRLPKTRYTDVKLERRRLQVLRPFPLGITSAISLVDEWTQSALKIFPKRSQKFEGAEC